VREPQKNNPRIRCEEIESLAVLHACGELDDAARGELAAHIAQCPACVAVVER
jgi:anti-sigma factor RsiW